MALGLERQLAEYIGSELGVGLYDDPDPAARVVYVVAEPPIYTTSPDPLDGETTNELTITVFYDGGAAPLLRLQVTYAITIQVRHPKYETAMAMQHAIDDLLQENGGQSNGAAPHAKGRFGQILISRITANFPPQPVGRDGGSRDGRFATSQTFTVRAKRFALA